MNSEDPSGRVISVDGSAGMALVEVDAAAVCARCASGKGCGAGLLGGRTKVRRIAAKIPPTIRLHTGDIVQISLIPAKLLGAAGMVYGLPLVGAALGAASAYQLQLGDVGAALSALVGLAVGLGAARQSLSQDRCINAFTPSVRSLVKTAPANDTGQA